MVRKERTFMMRNDTARNLDLLAIRNIARGRLEEEERLLGHSVVELLDVVDKVAAYSHDLSCRCVSIG